MQSKLIIASILLCPLHAISNIQLPILPAEVVARDLDIPGLGAVGHVGVTMASTLDEVAPWMVEVLNETKVVQVNYISTFKTRSPYWGSRYGIANDRQSTLNVLREANSQRCLKSNYTLTSIS